MIRTLFRPDWRAVWRDDNPPESASVYTRPEIVSLILDLADYEADTRQLLDVRVLEPSCGDGAFLNEIVSRLVESARPDSGKVSWNDPRWEGAITAVDLSCQAINKSRSLVAKILAGKGCPQRRASSLADLWIRQSDFLLHDWGHTSYDVVVGNPPYVRIEQIPSRVYAEYKNLWHTASDRADLYVPFFECGLNLLSDGGVLAFICANRFAKNQYGSSLRRLIAYQYHVRHYINLEHTQPFLAKVSAYPAIIVIDKNRGSPTHAETVEDIESSTLNRLREGHGDVGAENHFPDWYPDGAPWISTSKSRHANLTSLVRDYPTIEESAPGTRIGIGIATGADEAFVLPNRRDDIEASRQVPLIMSGDISNQRTVWSGNILVNPFDDAGDGSLVDLNRYPGLRAHFDAFEASLRKRHCAQNRPGQWYRTIDRFWPWLMRKPKLVIPDIQLGGIIGYEPGECYPHHNVYWIVSDSWDLKELQRILQSDFVTDQIRAFSVAMRGGSLRYQVQNLRKVRIPWAQLNDPHNKTGRRKASPSISV